MMTLTGPWKRRPSSWCRTAHRARASVHAGCPQSGAWPHHGTTSAVEQEPQAKIRSLAVPGSLAGVTAALERRRAGRTGRVVLPRRPSWCPAARVAGPAVDFTAGVRCRPFRDRVFVVVLAVAVHAVAFGHLAALACLLLPAGEPRVGDGVVKAGQVHLVPGAGEQRQPDRPGRGCRPRVRARPGPRRVPRGASAPPSPAPPRNSSPYIQNECR